MIRRLSIAAMLAALVFSASPSQADDPALTAEALRLAAARDWPAAVTKSRAAGPLASDIVTWQLLRDGAGDFATYRDFLARHPDWPGLPLLREKGEKLLTGVPADEVIAYFRGLLPQTGTGSAALVDAFLAKGDGKAAGSEAVRAWRSLPMSDDEHGLFLARFGDILKDHHDGRTAAMLRAGSVADARRMLPLNSAYTAALAKARIALQANDKGVDDLIAALPEKALASGGLAYDRFRWRIRKNFYDSAGALMLERSVTAETLGDPEQWADWRRRLARKEMREGDGRRAYEMASRHFLNEGSDFADLEWLSGYIALRKLHDPERALGHFKRFAKAVNGPISLARAGYWQGRAYEALGRAAEANAAYAEGARYQTAFYGLLSAEKIGLPLSPAMTGRETYPDWRGSALGSSSVFQAAQLLQAAGDRLQAQRFLLHLAEGLAGEDIGRLAGLAIEWGDANTALLLAKAAADKGVVWPGAYFPMNGIEAMSLPVAPELALAIARRESEFNPAAVSGVGARGLMQVMPATAKRMAVKLGLGYDGGKLTTDWQYNAKLGAAYLADLVSEFGAVPVLVSAGYNAGPGRPRNWIKELGDPRSPKVDVVDWIEHIPFRETQNYIMRVSESLPIYRARLSGKTGPLRFTDELKGVTAN
ncbi:MAG: transglycosylase SLT domain-containing protein [Rhodobacteraceae bacterium]|nr:transglycosylase SLT domain-containing protein [Paracoccaceae bacterium]